MHREPAESPHAGERRRDEHAVVALVAQRARDETERAARAQRDVAERGLAARDARHAAHAARSVPRGAEHDRSSVSTPPARCVAGSASWSDTPSGASPARTSRDSGSSVSSPDADRGLEHRDRRRGRARRGGGRCRARRRARARASAITGEPAHDRQLGRAARAARAARPRRRAAASARRRSRAQPRAEPTQRLRHELTTSLGHADAREQRGQHVVGAASFHLELRREVDAVAQHGGRRRPSRRPA